ncbi:hypothetical protein [Mycolicibacterium vulneris]|uniref:hypothetical protein n=1 Tax=Mycolicibacterium vulneris TaxID=547163 RepID=UPI0013FD3882|nr:hypothetical protein [Mycolicibacterium vulneris]
MTKQEIARLVASLTDDEVRQLRDFLTDTENSDSNGVEAGQFAKSLFGGSND